MPWGPVAGAVVSSMLAPSGGGGAPSGSSPVNVLPNQAGVAQNYQNSMNAYGQQAGQYSGTSPNMANQAFNAQYNNPYAGGYQQAAGQAGQMYDQGAQAGYNNGMNGYGAANQVLNTAFDPQNALYNQTANNLMNQTNAQQALRGLGNSPQGAQEAGTTLGNFNID